MFSSVTGLATSVVLLSGWEAEVEEGGRELPLLVVRYARWGTTVITNFRVLAERFTRKISQLNGSPTRTSPAAEKVSVIPISASAPALFSALSVDAFAEPGRLAGRLLRCIDCEGFPKLGFKAVEKSTLLRQRISIWGRQRAETRTVAEMETSRFLAWEAEGGSGSAWWGVRR